MIDYVSEVLVNGFAINEPRLVRGIYRQAATSELESRMAPGSHDRREDAARYGWLFSVVHQGWNSTRTTAGEVALTNARGANSP